MSAFGLTSGRFVREQLRAPLTLVLLIAIPVFFVLIFAGVLGEFSKALGEHVRDDQDAHPRLPTAL